MNANMGLAKWVLLAVLVAGSGCTSIRGVRPVYPAPDQTVSDLQPLLKWEAAEDPEATYDLAISMKGVKEGASKREYYREGLAGTSHKVETSLKPGTLYTWSLRTRKGDEVGDWNKQESRIFLLLYYHSSKRPLTFRTP
mgnify:CR=1 FL=1